MSSTTSGTTLLAMAALATAATSRGETLATSGSAPPDTSDLDPVELHDQALGVLERYCVSCHGPEKQKGKVRLDALETIDPVDRQELYRQAAEALSLGEMPPDDAPDQPADADREILVQWLGSQLTGEAAKALAEKLQRFEYGNVVDHEALFSGEHADLPGFTHDRRWLISEFIFNEKVNGLLDYHPTRTIDGEVQEVAGDSGIHWSPKSEHGNKFRRTITNPFLLPKAVGVRYSVHERLTTGRLLTMVGNARRIAGHMTSEPVMKAHYSSMLALMQTELAHREVLRARERFLTTYGYMDRLLEDIHGAEHAALLPELVRKEIAYPGPLTKRQDVPVARNANLGFLPRFDGEDIQAIFHGIATYKTTPFEISEVTEEAALNDKGEPIWAPYSDADRAEFDRIILQSERDWVNEGVTEHRIENRIATMKIFFDTWDMNTLYRHIAAGNHGPPEYVPLDDAEMAVISETISKHRRKGDSYLAIIDKCLTEWQASFKAERQVAGGAEEAQMGRLVIELYDRVFERQPTAEEITENVSLLKRYTGNLDLQPAIAKLIESLVLSTDFAYRYEFGTGEADEHGRRMMAPQDASYALAYALTDSSPDAELAKAAEEGRLNTRDDYEREVRRMLERRDQWTIVDEAVQAANLNASVTNLPIRKLRFFRDFFGYPKAMEVFKDDARFGAGRHDAAVSRLIDEADLLVAHILERDEQVLETLLTTEDFFVFHSGDNEAMKTTSDRLKRMYDYFKDFDWETWEIEDLAPHKPFLDTMWEFQKMQGDDKAMLRGFQTHMKGLVLQFGDGQSGGLPYMKQGMGFWHGGPVLGRTGQQMRGEQVASYWNLDWRTWDYPAEQPASIPDRKGILTHPAWLIAHSQNLETDPIHRGKWVREKLLAGTIPDVPIEVDAVIPPDHGLTLRERMEDRTGAAYCWRCHQKMDPLGFPFEQYDDFGRFRMEEFLEHPDNLITPAPKPNEIALLTYGAALPTYKSKPVDPRGGLDGTGDPALDGEVEDAFDLIDRLARSDKVRQSILRHAFRYFMGRNETFSDSRTLIDADRAYLESNGSFDAVIVSLLTSDSFIYRKPTEEL